jgi:hypothetical protein
MTPSQIRGAFLEYLVRRLLKSCGFLPVVADNLYTYESSGLFYINGKGAAHDADVLMEPPVQIPFAYPSRMLFECKAFREKTSLSIIRNVLGLRYDINEFEIVTKRSIAQRKNNRRSNYAIEERKRFNYQVGVASVGNFTKPAIEFAANNKIPLLSLSWFLNDSAEDKFQAIDNEYLKQFNDREVDVVYKFFKDKKLDAEDAQRNQDAKRLLHNDEIIGSIIESFNEVLNYSYVGIIETGDLIFLFPHDEYVNINHLRNQQPQSPLKAQLHYFANLPNHWTMDIFSEFENQPVAKFKFFLPERIMNFWKSYILDRPRAIHIKREFFSRIFIFKKGIYMDFPFFMVNLDREWFDTIRDDT